MRFDELLALHKHSARSAAGIVDTALVGSKHLHQHAYDVRRSIELAALLALGAGKLREKIFIHAAKHVHRSICRAAKRDIADKIDELPEPLLVQTGTRIVLGQHALKRWIVAFNGSHRIVH